MPGNGLIYIYMCVCVYIYITPSLRCSLAPSLFISLSQYPFLNLSLPLSDFPSPPILVAPHTYFHPLPPLLSLSLPDYPLLCSRCRKFSVLGDTVNTASRMVCVGARVRVPVHEKTGRGQGQRQRQRAYIEQPVSCLNSNSSTTNLLMCAVKSARTATV